MFKTVLVLLFIDSMFGVSTYFDSRLRRSEDVIHELSKEQNFERYEVGPRMRCFLSARPMHLIASNTMTRSILQVFHTFVS
jgi:hypothetical protein